MRPQGTSEITEFQHKDMEGGGEAERELTVQKVFILPRVHVAEIVRKAGCSFYHSQKGKGGVKLVALKKKENFKLRGESATHRNKSCRKKEGYVSREAANQVSVPKKKSSNGGETCSRPATRMGGGDECEKRAGAVISRKKPVEHSGEHVATTFVQKKFNRGRESQML